MEDHDISAIINRIGSFDDNPLSGELTYVGSDDKLGLTPAPDGNSKPESESPPRQLNTPSRQDGTKSDLS